MFSSSNQFYDNDEENAGLINETGSNLNSPSSKSSRRIGKLIPKKK